MGFGLYSLIEATLLVINAMAVLNEERFLSKLGWGQEVAGFGQQPGAKQQFMTLVRSVRTVMRVPLIAINGVVILYKVVLGS